MNRAWSLAAVVIVLLTVVLPGCGSDTPTGPTRTLLTQGQMAFPRPELGPGVQPLFGVVNFALPARGDLEVTADWGNAANVFTINLRHGTCDLSNQVNCALAASATAGGKPSRLTLAAAAAGSYTLGVLAIPEGTPGGPPAGPFFPETVTYQVFLTN